MSLDRSRISRNNKGRAKQDERDVARILGGKRHPADVGGGEDVSHPDLAIQVKGGQSVVNNTLRKGMEAAKGACPETKQPCVVLVDRSGTRTRRYIVFELEPYAAWNGYG